MQKAIISHGKKTAHTGKLIGKKKAKKKSSKQKAMKKNDVKRMQRKCLCVCVSAVWKVIKSKEDPKSKSEKKIP